MKTIIKLIATIMLLGAFYQVQSQDVEPDVIEKVSLDVSSKSVSFSSDGGEKSLTVTSNAKWTLQNLPEWCSGVQNGNTLTLTCAKNTGADRSGSFTIVAGGSKTVTVRIRQQGTIILVVEPASISVHSYQGQEAVNVNTNYGEWKVRNYPEWCSTGAKEKTGFILQYKENPNVSPRQGQITIAAGALVKTINITQQGKSATPPVSDDKRLEITEVKFGFKKDELENFNSEIYSDVTYLYPKITYRNLASEPKRITLGFKLFDPTGKQMTPDDASTTKYTYTGDISLSGSESRKIDDCISSNGYGNPNGTMYKTPGIYNCEIWCNDELKHRTQFAVLKREGEVDSVKQIQLSIAEEDKFNNLFLSDGGAKRIDLSTNAKSYQVAGKPDWITVEKYPDHIIIRSQANPGAAPRDESFNIVAGNASERIFVKQAGKPGAEPLKRFRFGAFVGLNFPGMTTNSAFFENRNMLNSPGFGSMYFNGGVLFEVKLNKFVSIQPELTFVQKGFKTKGYVDGIYEVNGTPVSAHEEVTARISYVEVPLYVVVNIPVIKDGGFCAGAGPSAAYGLSAKSKTRATLGDYDPLEVDMNWFEEELLGRMDYGVNFLAGFEYKWIFIRGGYNLGIADIAKEKGDGRANFKNKGFNVSIGFKF
jgi:hypothetical protein